MKLLSLSFATIPCSSNLIELAHYNRPLIVVHVQIHHRNLNCGSAGRSGGSSGGEHCLDDMVLAMVSLDLRLLAWWWGRVGV